MTTDDKTLRANLARAIKGGYVPVWLGGCGFPTHAAALAHALAEVGLTKKEQS